MNQRSNNRKLERQSYYKDLKGRNLAPLWENLDTLVPRTPATPCQSAIWKYDEIRPSLMKSGRIITAEEAIRRVLVLENPGMLGHSSITHSLYAGWQLIMPGELAPSHRHTQTALRLIVEGEGAYTAVDGERVVMRHGDFIITPPWSWHEHGNATADPVVWLDGLDIPLVNFFDAGFSEEYPDGSQDVVRSEEDSFFRYGNNLRPIEVDGSTSSGSLFAYPYAKSYESLEKMAASNNPDSVHGYKMEFINPLNGGSAMKTMSAFIQLLPDGFSGQNYRSTDGTVFSVIAGSGTASIGGEDFAFSARDVFVVPSWTNYSLKADTQVVMFSFSDRPVQRVLGLWREER